jgi:hypothetical protein
VFVGVDGDLHPVTQPELGEDAGDVALDRGLAEVEPGGDLRTRAYELLADAKYGRYAWSLAWREAKAVYPVRVFPAITGGRAQATAEPGAS